jgi:hypothetical protein
MKIDLPTLLKTVGLPVALAVVFGAVLLVFGMTLGQVLSIAAMLVGVPLMIALLIDVLKLTGVVDDGMAGKWSAGMNLIVLVAIAVVLKVVPNFDFGAADAQLVTLAQFGMLVLSYIVQIVGSQQLHTAYTYGLGIRKFSLTTRSTNYRTL